MPNESGGTDAGVPAWPAQMTYATWQVAKRHEQERKFEKNLRLADIALKAIIAGSLAPIGFHYLIQIAASFVLGAESSALAGAQ